MQAERVQPLGRFMRIKQVIEETGLCRSEIYDRVKAGKFPAPINLAEQGSGRRISAWVEAEIDEWKREVVAAQKPTLSLVKR